MSIVDRSAWKHVRFGDVVHQVKDRIDPQTAGLQRYIAGEHMDSGQLLITRWGTVGDGYLGPAFHMRFQPGQVLLGSRRTYLKKVAFADFAGICANTTYVAESADPSRLLPKYLPLVMSSDAFLDHAIQQSKGSVNPYVNWSDLARWEFDLPPVMEQERISSLLWGLEREKRSLSRALTAIGIVRDAFIRDERNGHPEWPEVEMGSVLAEPVRNGVSIQSSSDTSDVPTISISAIREGAVDFVGNLKYMVLAPKKAASFALKLDDFLVVRGNGNKDLVGRGGLVRDLPVAGCVYPDLLIRLRPDPDRIIPEFLPVAWNEKTAHNLLIRKAKSTNGIWKVNGKDVATHRLTIPPLDDQRRILDGIHAIDEARDALLIQAQASLVLRTKLTAEVLG